METPEEGGCEDPFKALSEFEIFGAERARLCKDWTGAEGLTAILKNISRSPSPSSAAGVGELTLSP